MSTKELDKYTDTSVLDVTDVKTQVQLIHRLMKDVMKEGVHYGTIPGTPKPTLYKAGAEKINFMFRLSATFKCEIKDLPKGHREVIATCTLTHIPTDKVWGDCVGSCTTLEGKYRFRNDIEWTGESVPKAYWDKRDVSLLGGRDFVAKKNDQGVWEIAKKSGKIEHDNPADYYNVVLKMAQKRAMVSADIGSTAASDIFTVDIEDMPEVIPGAKGKEEPIEVEVVEPEETDTTEEDWKREEARHAEEGGAGQQTSIPTGPPKNEYEGRPFPGTDKPEKIDKGKAKFLYAKFMNVPGWEETERQDFLRDIGFDSVYAVTEDQYENVKKTLETFYKK